MTRFLDIPYISRTRRNHGLEHATIHILTDDKRRRMAGHSDAGGFWILGEIGTEELLEAVTQALERLRAGERNLAVHPNCGTNLATYGTFAGFGAFAALAGSGPRFRDKMERLPMAALFATLALILAQPLAFRLQEQVTTSGDPEGLEIVRVTRTAIGSKTAHRIETRG